MKVWVASAAAIAISLVAGACGEDTISPEPDSIAFSDTSSTDLGPGTCSTAEDCDDNFSCTIDTCSQGSCSWSIDENLCFINGSCRAKGEVLGCGVCAPSVSQTQWSNAPNGTECEDSDPCTDTGFCASGQCETETSTCDDNNDCTIDSCAPDTGCENILKTSGTACTPGSACFEAGTCADGACKANAISCDDNNACTADTCDPIEGCQNIVTDGACDDGDACTSDGSCDEGICLAGQPEECDDGNTCTIDSCHPIDGCSHLEVFSPCCTGLVSVCDDGNPCTNDECDPITKDCSYSNNNLPCNDGDACTSDDSCTEAVCVGQPVDCSDGNDCTFDQCSPETGCDHVPTTGTACDDGLACSTGDICIDGQCTGDTTDCVCVPAFSSTASKLTSISLGDGGYAGEALDIDKNPTTCSPEDSCSDGIDNSFASMAEVTAAVANLDINDEMATNTEAGWIMLVVELRNLNKPNFAVAIYQSKLDPANSDCDFQKNVCSYWAVADMLDEETCEPAALLPATLEGNKIIAGGQGTKLPFEIPFQGGIMLNIVLYDLSFEGTVDLDGDEVVTFGGVLGAAIPQEDLEASILSLPADALGGIDPADALPLLSLALDYDIDVPGKGPAASIGLKLQGIGAKLTGVKP